MIKELKYNDEIILQVKVELTKDIMSFDGIEPGKCTNNAKLIVENNPELDIIYVEGVVIYYYDDNDFYADIHAWNKFNDYYFDSTLETLDVYLREHEREDLILRREYFPYRELDVSDLEYNNDKSIVKFSNESSGFMNAMLKKYPNSKAKD
ncbi:hypothetical protein V8G56_02150 [Gaetbulibacter aquiaggeris]|uniref:Uncharacterized protein n=1 Tax=Gaetbulibacter aquiaggeris TaxID=1735373 RepID=A0ABW7ML35_9FLAO